MNELLSVIVPVYNVRMYLKECVESIISQTYSNLEIILVDDGSTDGSGEQCDKYASEDERIIVIHKKNGGLISSRKAGVQAARGEYVTFVDGDDWIELDLYEKIFKNINSKCDVLCCGYKWDKEIEYNIITNLAENGEYKEESIRQKLILGLFCNESTMRGTINYSVWSKVFRKELLYKNLMEMREDYAYGEDVVCMLPCILDAKYIIVDNDICGYHYRWNESSMTNSYDKMFYEHSLALFSEIDRIIESRKCNGLIDHVRKYKLYVMFIGIGKMTRGEKKYKVVEQYKYYKKLSRSTVINEILSHYDSDEIPFGKREKRIYAALKRRRLVWMTILCLLPCIHGTRL